MTHRSDSHSPGASRPIPQLAPSAASPPPANGAWRCTTCSKLLGQLRDGRLHVRFARSHEYLVSLPAQASCRGCGTLNEATALTR